MLSFFHAPARILITLIYVVQRGPWYAPVNQLNGIFEQTLEIILNQFSFNKML